MSQIDWDRIVADADNEARKKVQKESENGQNSLDFISEPHVAYCLLVDTSGSMQGSKIDELNRALQHFKKDVCADPLSAKRVDVCVVEFNSKASIVTPFCPIAKFKPPTLSAHSTTAMATGIRYAIEAVHDQVSRYHAAGIECYEKLKMYYVTGGMPEPVLMWTEARDVSAMQEALSGIIGSYERDFAKHPDISEFPKISMIWKSVPSQLARENKKFIYKVVKEGARAREYEDALQWLVDARLVHKIYRSSAPRLPVAAYDDLSAFKIYLVDVGLLRRLAQLAPTAFGEGNRLFTEFKGALTENFVLQTLITQFEVVPRYWSQNNPPYEVDFLVQRENDIFPVEVKSEANTTSRSLRKFKELFPDQVKLRVRFSLDNLKLDDDVLNIPLFMADQTDRLIGLALEQRNGKK